MKNLSESDPEKDQDEKSLDELIMKKNQKTKQVVLASANRDTIINIVRTNLKKKSTKFLEKKKFAD